MSDIQNNAASEVGTGAVLPGKPNPIDYGAIRRPNGSYWWPKGDKFGRIKVHGVWLPRKRQMELYKIALANWQKKSAAYSVRVSSMGPDRALRASLRATQAQIAAQSNRIALLEQQLESSNVQPTPWSDENAYYYNEEAFEPDGYFDDEGFYGQFDGMSGADGDLGLVRRYGHIPDNGDGVSGAQGEDLVDGLEDILEGGDGEDMVEGLEGGDSEDMVEGLEVGDTMVDGLEDVLEGLLEGADGDDVGMTLAQRVQADARNRQAAADRAAANRRKDELKRRPIRLPPQARSGSAKQPISKGLRAQLMAAKRSGVNIRALISALRRAGFIIANETAKKQMEIRRRRIGDGLAGQNLPPPPPPPGIGGATMDDLGGAVAETSVGLGGAIRALPPPPPPPSVDDLSGPDCGCALAPGAGDGG